VLLQRVKLDENLRQLATDLGYWGHRLSRAEIKTHEFHTGPVDQRFIQTWRLYEEKYEPLVIYIYENYGLPGRIDEIRRYVKTENVDIDAEDGVESIHAVFELVNWIRNVDPSDQSAKPPNVDMNELRFAAETWKYLSEDMKIDFEGILRRRALAPFVLVPSHVSRHHGQTAKLSLFTHLKQAYDAYVFGVPFAALTLMRSILELTLRRHYGAQGADLSEMIGRCEKLPNEVSKRRLHRLRKLANDIVHVNSERSELPDNLEEEIWSLLKTLRSLIEGAPNLVK
jgi:hypothetical protein